MLTMQRYVKEERDSGLWKYQLLRPGNNRQLPSLDCLLGGVRFRLLHEGSITFTVTRVNQVNSRVCCSVSDSSYSNNSKKSSKRTSAQLITRRKRRVPMNPCRQHVNCESRSDNIVCDETDLRNRYLAIHDVIQMLYLLVQFTDLVFCSVCQSLQ